MLTCLHCGSDNALGLVFCRACGKRLPVEDLVREDWAQHQRKALWRRRIVRIVQGILGLWLLGCLLLAFRPRPFLEVPADREAALRLRFQLDALSQAIRLGHPLEVELKEEELNAYLRHAVLGKVSGRRGVVRVLDRQLYVLWHARLWEGAGSPVLSFEAVLLPSVRTGMLRITKTRMGRLSLGWPFNATVERLFRAMVQQRMEWPLVRQLRVASCVPGALTVETVSGNASDDDLRTLEKTLSSDLGLDDPFDTRGR